MWRWTKYTNFKNKRQKQFIQYFPSFSLQGTILSSRLFCAHWIEYCAHWIEYWVENSDFWVATDTVYSIFPFDKHRKLFSELKGTFMFTDVPFISLCLLMCRFLIYVYWCAVYLLWWHILKAIHHLILITYFWMSALCTHKFQTSNFTHHEPPDVLHFLRIFDVKTCFCRKYEPG